MDETSIAWLTRLGEYFLFQVSPGASFVGLLAGVSVAGALLRLVFPRTRVVRGWVAATGWIERSLITSFILAMIVLSLGQIVLRNAFETGFVWIDPLLRHLVLWVGFLGAMLAAAYDRHITIDVLSRLLRGRLARGAHAVFRLFAAGVAFLLANAGYLLVRDEFEFGSTSFLDIPTWALMMIIPVGLGVIGYRFVLSAGRGPVTGTSDVTTSEDAFVPTDERRADPMADPMADPAVDSGESEAPA